VTRLVTHGDGKLSPKMKQSIFDSVSQPKESPQSFVVRVWQEKPGQLRGTIRHVQTESQRGFERFDQVQQFIQRFAAASKSRLEQPSLPNWLRRPRFNLAYGFIVIIFMFLGIVMLGNSYSAASASASALSVFSLNSIIFFLAGTALGGSAVAIAFFLIR
jgi:hypothetical protein